MNGTKLSHSIVYLHAEGIEVETENTGGGCMVDSIVLSNGYTITLNEDEFAVYKDKEDFDINPLLWCSFDTTEDN